MKKVLLHICCGVCSLFAIERLNRQGYGIAGFFYNPNIAPEQEYIKRKEAAQAACRINKVSMIEGRYDPGRWLEVCREYKDEKEGGQRCRLCYQMRLGETQKICQEQGCDYFTTTLSISPHKKSRTILQIGEELDKEKFLAVDFKKDGGFKKTMDLAKSYGLYRQSYCGCLYGKILFV